jgi:signal transduction histidine kinase
MDLKWLLMKRISLVAAACFGLGAALAIYQTALQAKRQNEELADLVGRQLDLQLSRIGRSTDIPEHFPDWDVVTNLVLEPGQCVMLRGVDGKTQRSNCAGVNTAALNPPWWFLWPYRLLINSKLSASRPISFRNVAYGTVVTEYDAVATAGRAWTTIVPLLGFSAIFLAVLCLVTYFAIDRALLPAREILAGLNRLARGDLGVRLPAFRLAELNRISDVFNFLSEELRKATSERTELARRLVDTQEQERRHIARELHDEIAQRLSALSALAACLRTHAQRDATALAEEARELEKMASGLMLTLRRTLTYLRPQEIDDLGLIQSLEALVARHNETSGGLTRYSLKTTGGVEHLRAETSAHVYRIIQEALTNASKHANARNVEVLLNQIADGDRETIRLSVTDDGAGSHPNDKPLLPSGSGMIGMRERVIALSGKFAAGPVSSGGFLIQVEFPTLQRGA